MTLDWGNPPSLVFAARSVKHRPASHPIYRAHPDLAPRGEPDWLLLPHLIRQRRKGRGWSQDTLGALIGVSGPSIHYWETGRCRPSPEHLLEEALGRLW